MSVKNQLGSFRVPLTPDGTLELPPTEYHLHPSVRLLYFRKLPLKATAKWARAKLWLRKQLTPKLGTEATKNPLQQFFAVQIPHETKPLAFLMLTDLDPAQSERAVLLTTEYTTAKLWSTTVRGGDVVVVHLTIQDPKHAKKAEKRKKAKRPTPQPGTVHPGSPRDSFLQKGDQITITTFGVGLILVTGDQPDSTYTITLPSGTSKITIGTHTKTTVSIRAIEAPLQVLTNHRYHPKSPMNTNLKLNRRPSPRPRR